MDDADLEILVDLADRKIQRSTPTAAEYWRGFCKGIKVYFQQSMDLSFPDGQLLVDIADREYGDPRLEAYARGYCDGCKGRMSSGY